MLPPKQLLIRCPRCQTPFFALDGELYGACSSCFHVWKLSPDPEPVFPVPFPNKEKEPGNK